MFQYCKRYEVTCDVDDLRREVENLQRFNTASGMRSHATAIMYQDLYKKDFVSIPQAV